MRARHLVLAAMTPEDAAISATRSRDPDKLSLLALQTRNESTCDAASLFHSGAALNARS